MCSAFTPRNWPVCIKVGEVTRYIGDALACVVAETEAEARAAAACVKVDYEVLTPLLDMEEAETSPIHIHEQRQYPARQDHPAR